MADLSDDFLGGLLGDFGNVALGDGSVKAGAGVEVHQFAEDEVTYHPFGLLTGGVIASFERLIINYLPLASFSLTVSFWSG